MRVSWDHFHSLADDYVSYYQFYKQGNFDCVYLEITSIMRTTVSGCSSVNSLVITFATVHTLRLIWD
jgi:hypothetical protein